MIEKVAKIIRDSQLTEIKNNTKSIKIIAITYNTNRSKNINYLEIHPIPLLPILQVQI